MYFVTISEPSIET